MFFEINIQEIQCFIDNLFITMATFNYFKKLDENFLMKKFYLMIIININHSFFFFF